MLTLLQRFLQNLRYFLKKENKSEISKEQWALIRTGPSVYPPESFSLYNGTLDSKKVTGWVNKGYKDYAFKTFCPYYLYIEVDLTDVAPHQEEGLDLDTIEEFFLDGLQKRCVSHMVARMIVDQNVLISMYVENFEVIGQYLDDLSEAEERPFNFGFSLKEDAKWKEVANFFN